MFVSLIFGVGINLFRSNYDELENGVRARTLYLFFARGRAFKKHFPPQSDEQSAWWQPGKLLWNAKLARLRAVSGKPKKGDWFTLLTSRCQTASMK